MLLRIRRRLLEVNGYIEHFEIDWEPKSASKLLPQHSPLRQWYKEVDRALSRQGRSLSMPKETLQILEDVGFDDITHRTHRIPAGVWPFDHKQRNIGEWFHYLIAGEEQDLRLLETLAMGPLTRYLGWRAADVRKLGQECVKCVRTKEYQIYFTLYVLSVYFLFQARHALILSQTHLDGTKTVSFIVIQRECCYVCQLTVSQAAGIHHDTWLTHVTPWHFPTVSDHSHLAFDRTISLGATVLLPTTLVFHQVWASPL